MKTTKPLQRKKPLARKRPTKNSSLSSTKPSKRIQLPLERKGTRDLIKLADKVFSQYVRIRDSQRRPDGSWTGKCISCSRSLVVIMPDGKWIASSQNGHYIGRGNHVLRYSELNCNLQCAHCNVWRDKLTMLAAYKGALDLKYGTGTAQELEDSVWEYHSRRPELIQTIEDARTQLALYFKTA